MRARQKLKPYRFEKREEQRLRTEEVRSEEWRELQSLEEAGQKKARSGRWKSKKPTWTKPMRVEELSLGLELFEKDESKDVECC